MGIWRCGSLPETTRWKCADHVRQILHINGERLGHRFGGEHRANMVYTSYLKTAHVTLKAKFPPVSLSENQNQMVQLRAAFSSTQKSKNNLGLLNWHQDWHPQLCTHECLSEFLLPKLLQKLCSHGFLVRWQLHRISHPHFKPRARNAGHKSKSSLLI